MTCPHACAHTAQVLGDVHGNGVALLFECVLLCRAPLQMYLFGTAKVHYGLRGIAQMEWVPIELCC